MDEEEEGQMPKRIVLSSVGERPEQVVFDPRSQKLTAFSWQGTMVSVEKVEKRWTATRYGLLQTFYCLQTPLGRFYLIFHIHPETREYIWWLRPGETG